MPPELIAHYRVTGKLGEGGMGAVYRATDTKLARQVAIKVLPDAFAEDPDRLARFTREAQVLASLSHVNIATIFGIEERAIVMELIEGPTLADRIQQGAIPIEEALGIARQIADALEAAHEKNVIHRDLKPANIKVTPEGIVKVLDFGLAKLTDPRETASDPASAPTMAVAQSPTMAGVIMGTAEYMSPEQASGKPVDRRTDIWAFGVVLWEMLHGRRMFTGETVSHTLADVLRAPIDFSGLPASLPRPVRDLLVRCLDRDTKTRLRDIGEARVVIQRYLANPNPAVEVPLAPAPEPARRPILPWVMAALLVPVAGGMGWMLRRTPSTPVMPLKFQLLPPEGVQLSGTGYSISPDGRYLILLTVSGPLYLRDLAEATWRELPTTFQPLARSVAWSHDSKSIVFAQNSRWWRMEIAGGTPLTLCEGDISPRGAAWNEQGTILVTFNGVIHRIPAAGGTPVPVTITDRNTNERHGFPDFLPGGRFFVYTAWSVRGGTAWSGTAWIGDLEGKEAPKRLLDVENQDVTFAAGAGLESGLLLIRRGGRMMGVPFDARRRVITGEPVPIPGKIADNGTSYLAVVLSRPARVLVAAEGESEGELSLIDRQGQKVSVLAPPADGAFGHLEFSPDGKILLGSRPAADRSRELWAVDIVRGAISRVTFSDSQNDKAQGWAPDGRRVFYMSIGPDQPGIWVTQANGTGKPESLLKTTGHHIGVSPDGRYVAFERQRSIGLLDVTKPGTAVDLITGKATYGWPQFSPDGRWLAYVSDETGREEVYVQSFPPGGGKWQVSRTGGRLARWRRDGKELVFVDGRGEATFYSVAVRQKGTELELDAPAQLFKVSMVSTPGWNYFALSPDGQRIALNLLAPKAVGASFTVMVDWLPGLLK